jgi:hypothetical protein
MAGPADSNDPTELLPIGLREQVRRIQQTEVAGGRARFRRDGDRTGLAGQRAISQLLQAAGIAKDSPQWTAIIDQGRALYEGRGGGDTPAPKAVVEGDGTGPVLTKGRTYRARAEAHQRTFRVEALHVGHGKWGHVLEARAATGGLNFHHPAARKAAQVRAAAGKGVDRARTFGNMLSSQAMCFNLFAPLAEGAEGLTLVAAALSPFVPGLLRVTRLEIEYTPPEDVFNDQAGLAGVDCDVLVHFEAEGDTTGVLVIETKFTEPAFSGCGHRAKTCTDPCPADVQVGADTAGCRYVSRNGYAYWSRAEETGSLQRFEGVRSGCPFGGPLWQIWVNHTLAHVLAARSGAARAVFAVLAPADNTPLLEGGAVVDRFRALAADPTTVLFIPLERFLDRLVAVTEGRSAWEPWAKQVRRRYTVPSVAGSAAIGRLVAGAPERITPGHRRVLAFMATPAFGEMVAEHRRVCGDRATIYFRPTDKGLVRVGLHPLAPGYVGFRTDTDDDGYLLTDPETPPTTEEITARLAAFEAWLPTVRRRSVEERGVIPWLRRALDGDLSLSDLGPGWVFLHQEWRFVDEKGTPRKSDILAVHLPTGRLGIIEFKASDMVPPEARLQVQAYGRFWQAHATELAPFFTEMLRALGVAYGNADAARGRVGPQPAALFVGMVGHGGRVSLTPC